MTGLDQTNPFGSMYGRQLQEEALRRGDRRGNFWRKLGNGLENATKESQSAKDQRANLNESGNQASNFADYLQGGVRQLSEESQGVRDYLRNVAQGGQSISQEQLRQALQQQLAAQRSMAAGAPAGSGPMAARNAAMNMNRAATGMSGQAALAGLQERRDAQNALAQMLMQQRGQDVSGALGSRGNAITAYGGLKPEGSKLEQWLPLINAGISAAGAF